VLVALDDTDQGCASEHPLLELVVALLERQIVLAKDRQERLARPDLRQGLEDLNGLQDAVVAVAERRAPLLDAGPTVLEHVTVRFDADQAARVAVPQRRAAARQRSTA